VAKRESPFFPGIDLGVLAATIAAYQELGNWSPHVEITRPASRRRSTSTSTPARSPAGTATRTRSRSRRPIEFPAQFWQMLASARKYSGKVFATQSGSLIVTATPPSETSEKHIAMR